MFVQAMFALIVVEVLLLALVAAVEIVAPVKKKN
jgi:hypothetical protein